MSRPPVVQASGQAYPAGRSVRLIGSPMLSMAWAMEPMCSDLGRVAVRASVAHRRDQVAFAAVAVAEAGRVGEEENRLVGEGGHREAVAAIGDDVRIAA